MHVILMSERAGRTISFQLRRWHGAVLAGLVLATAVASGVLGFSFAPVTTAASHLAKAVEESAENQQLAQLAMRVGELQARLSRLTAIGERVAGKAGVPVAELSKTATPGQGGPLESVGDSPLSPAEISQLLDTLSAQFAQEGDKLQVMDRELLDRQIRQGRLNLDKPVEDSGYQSSHFGLRTDPFTGRLARHRGVDFADTMGAPILAAESGIVVFAGRHPQYGNVLDVDHGNGLVTRYGHADRLLVKLGEMVKRGQQIAEVGSSGRSTGPHLHFEVLKNGVRQNPTRFLKNHS